MREAEQSSNLNISMNIKVLEKGETAKAYGGQEITKITIIMQTALNLWHTGFQSRFF